MKKLILILVVISFFACTSEDVTESVNNLDDVTYLKYTLKEKNDPENLVYTQEYTFDDEGKVISETFTNFYNPNHNYSSTFEYNEKGQVIKEIREGQAYRSITWTNDFAEVFNNQDQKISEFRFVDTTLKVYKTEYNTENVRTRVLNYDPNQNIISVENETEVIVEYLNYNTTKRNPFNLIKSIGILRIDYKPFFKNIFSTEKVYPFEGDDYSQPLTLYDYQYEFDAQHRVYQIEDDKSLIYTQEFIYQ